MKMAACTSCSFAQKLIKSSCLKTLLSRPVTEIISHKLFMRKTCGNAGYRHLSIIQSTPSQHSHKCLQTCHRFQGQRSHRSEFSETLKSTESLLPPEIFCVHATQLSRSFSTTISVDSQFGMGGTGQEKEGDSQTGRGSTVKVDWAVRLANENGCLSWCRNTYLTTVVAIAMMGEGTTPLAQMAAEGAFFISALNLTWGTFQYMYNIGHLRRGMGMSRFGALSYMSLATLHLVLWFVVCSLYLGYTEDPDMKAIEEEARRASEEEEEEQLVKDK